MGSEDPKTTQKPTVLNKSNKMEMKCFLLLATMTASSSFAFPQYPLLGFPYHFGGLSYPGGFSYPGGVSYARLTVRGSGVPSTGTTGNYIGKQPSAKKVIKPSAESALAYMKIFFGEEDLCSASGLAYLENILNGKTGAEANAAAEAAYKTEWAKGTRLRPGSACEKANVAFIESYNSGKETILESALAFVKAWPGLQEGNPCAVSGKAYMEAIIEGKSIDEAGLLSGKAFIEAFGDLARSGKSVVDSSCAAAAKSFISGSNIPDSASAESAMAFIDATLGSSSSGYDPVCAASALAYMDAFAAGKDSLTANLIAAKAFYQEYAKGTSPGPNSPCVKASLAYAAKVEATDSGNSDAMVAFIKQAVKDGENATDPVCAAATLAYLDAKIAGKSDKEAGANSAEAYIQAFSDNGGKTNEACRKA